MNMEEQSKYKVDITQTLLSNIFWLVTVFIVLTFIIIGFGQLQTLEQTDRLLYLIVISFASIKLITWIGRPHLHFERREIK